MPERDHGCELRTSELPAASEDFREQRIRLSKDRVVKSELTKVVGAQSIDPRRVSSSNHRISAEGQSATSAAPRASGELFRSEGLIHCSVDGTVGALSTDHFA